MEYYIMKSSVTKPSDIVLLKEDEYAYSLTKENFDMFPGTSAGYYELNSETFFPDVMVKPTFMVSDALKKVLLMYDDTLLWKSIFMMPYVEEPSPEGVQIYHIISIPRVDCLDKEARILPNGSVEKVILDAKRLANKDIFMVDNVVENIVIVSLRVAESISRRNMLGVRFERVEVK